MHLSPCFLYFSTIDLICRFHVSCVSKWSSRHLTCFVCVICVLLHRMFGGIFFRSVNVIWLHLLGFAFICFSRSQFSIFMICSCSILTAVSGLVCLTSIAVSSANVNTVLLVVGMFAVYNVYSIGPRTLPCGTPALMSLTWEYVSLIFIRKVLLLRWDFINWCICSGNCFLIVCSRLSWLILSNAFSMSIKRAVQYSLFSSATIISFINLCICSIVECLFLKPNWWSGISFFISIIVFIRYFGKYWKLWYWSVRCSLVWVFAWFR